MDEQERAEYEQEGKRLREEHVKNSGQHLVEELQYILGPKLKKHKVQICKILRIWSVCTKIEIKVIRIYSNNQNEKMG